MTPRRTFLIGTSAAVAGAPAIVRIGNLMPVRRIGVPFTRTITNITVCATASELNGVIKVEN